MKDLYKDLYYKFLNSHFWFHIYYKHTSQHKNDIKRIQDEILEKRAKFLKDRKK
jgi:hypothetical protein